MRLNNIEIRDNKYRIVNADIFDTNNTFKAMLVIEDYTIRTEGARVLNEGVCILNGVNDDYSDFNLEVELDWLETNGEWSLVYVGALDE